MYTFNYNYFISGAVCRGTGCGKQWIERLYHYGIAGSSLNMMILIYSYQVSFTQLMNTDFVTIEVIRGIAGSLGILLAVPCVASITAVLLSKKRTIQS